MKDEILKRLESVREELSSLRKALKALKTRTVAVKGLRDQAANLSRRWHDEVEPSLRGRFSIQDATLADYRGHFQKLFKLSAPNNLSKSYLVEVDAILNDFRDELILPVHSHVELSGHFGGLASILQGISFPDQKEYLKEAVGCAQQKFVRASIVMGWCATMHHIHCKIELIGLDQFNKTGDAMEQKRGKWKNFRKPPLVASINELREVSDRQILWVLEGMNLVDNTEHARLEHCLDLRIQSSHPGDAPVKEANLVAFFSDITEIVLKNPKFAL